MLPGISQSNDYKCWVIQIIWAVCSTVSASLGYFVPVDTRGSVPGSSATIAAKLFLGS